MRVITQELVDRYKGIMILFLDASEKGKPSGILSSLEKIPDQPDDLIKFFQIANINPPLPSHWIGLMRFMRLSMYLLQRIQTKYESFMNSYSVLGKKKAPNENESHLHQEIGNFLYKADDSMGRQERTLAQLVETSKTLLMDNFGITDNPGEEFFRASISLEATVKIENDLKELSSICKELLHEMLIMERLDKIRKLILE